jgi:transposase
MDGSETSKAVNWESHLYFMGLDWASRHHSIVVLDREGRIVWDKEIEHTLEGWRQLHDKLAELAGQNLSVIATAVETNCGPAVEKLLEFGCSVYPLNPKAAQRYRDRKSPCGVKTDYLDALSFADAIRTDGHAWRRLKPEDPVIQELRLLCRDEIALIGQRTTFINQLRAALKEYYPAVLDAFEIWNTPAPWKFVLRFPTPEALKKSGKRQMETFFHTHHLYRADTYAKRIEILEKATDFCGNQAVTNAKSLLAVSIAKQLCSLEDQLKHYREHIEQLFSQHPDNKLFGSLPGAGSKLAPRLLSECGDDRERFQDHESLQAYAGTAPISFQSGQMHKVKFRHACNKNLRTAVHMWADLSRHTCSWAQIYYTQKRKEGKSHACATRCLGQRWLKILWKMCQTGQIYNEQLHMRNQLQHGSWVLTMATVK